MTDPAPPPNPRSLVEEGLREAQAISHPLIRVRHRTAWALRLARLAPVEAAPLLEEVPAEDPAQRVQFLVTLTSDLEETGATNLEPYFSQTLELARDTDPDTRLRVLNALCELAISLADRDRTAGQALIRLLAPEVRALDADGEEYRQYRALGSALVGEALLMLDDPEGEPLLREAEQLSEELPVRDSVAAFLANAWAPREADHAVALVEAMQDPVARLDSALQAAAAINNPALRERLCRLAEAEATRMEHMRGPEPLVHAGHALAALDPEAARRCFELAMASGAARGTAQLRSLHLTGVAAAAAALDREWSRQLFQEAIQAAGEEPERVNRVTALVLAANEMAEPHPREAAEVLEQAVREALELEAIWEYAHVLDVLFRPDRSAYLDVRAAAPLLDRLLARISDDDPRVPGVLGLADVARFMADVDPEQAAEVLQRWLNAAETAGDSDSMTQAAAALHRLDPEAGYAALRRVRDFLVRRIDCPAMGEFSRQAAPLAPDLVLQLAPYIPDRRERADAAAAAAIGLYAQDPAAALQGIRALEQPADRSRALLELVDGLLDTADRPQPQPLLEELP